MKIRLTLTLNITRQRKDATGEEAPYIDDRGYAATETAPYAPIGFQIQPTNPSDPFEDEQ